MKFSKMMERNAGECYNCDNIWEMRNIHMYDMNTILVVGQAKPSKEDAIYNLHGEFYISLVLDRENGKILDMDCNTILEVTKNFVATLLIGRSLRDDVQMLEKEIKERYFALTQKPLIACIKDAHNRYMMVTGQK